jgi:hypothetical protein
VSEKKPYFGYIKCSRRFSVNYENAEMHKRSEITDTEFVQISQHFNVNILLLSISAMNIKSSGTIMHHISTNKRAKLNQSGFTVHIEDFIKKPALTMLVSQASIVTQTSGQSNRNCWRRHNQVSLEQKA